MMHVCRTCDWSGKLDTSSCIYGGDKCVRNRKLAPRDYTYDGCVGNEGTNPGG